MMPAFSSGSMVQVLYTIAPPGFTSRAAFSSSASWVRFSLRISLMSRFHFMSGFFASVPSPEHGRIQQDAVGKRTFEGRCIRSSADR